MKKFIVLFMLLLFTATNSYADKEVPDSIFENINYAVYEMDNGNHDKSIAILKDIIQEFPKHYVANYELGYAYYLKQDYKKAISVLKKLEKHPSVDDMLYQMLGNAYDMNKNPDKALKTYFKGLKKFPASGKLYLEAGTVYAMHGEYNRAINCYEKGIEVEPGFPSNYFRAADLFCNSNEKVFGLMYGEIMVNMQPESPRAKIISKILFDTYKNSITFPNDTAISVSFTKKNAINFDQKTGGLNIPFEIMYEIDTAKGVTALLKDKDVNLKNLNEFRNLFIDNYFSSGNRSNLLFDYHKKLIEAGHFEAYNMWLLREGALGEFDMWVLDNEEKFVEFSKWHKENPLIVTPENRFSRETANIILKPEDKEK